MKDIGTKIKKLRQSRHMPQSELAAKAGIAQSTLSYIENGKKIPHFGTLSSICTALDLSVLELLAYEETESDTRFFKQDPSLRGLLQTLGSDPQTIGFTFRNNLSPDVNKELCEFEKYLYNKYKQGEAQ